MKVPAAAHELLFICLCCGGGNAVLSQQKLLE
jgi:hypothetical protein